MLGDKIFDAKLLINYLLEYKEIKIVWSSASICIEALRNTIKFNKRVLITNKTDIIGKIFIYNNDEEEIYMGLLYFNKEKKELIYKLANQPIVPLNTEFLGKIVIEINEYH